MALNLGLRPRLVIETSGDLDTVRDRIHSAASKYRVTVARGYLVIKIPETERHYWSPQLQVTLDDDGGRVHVNGLITPMPAVWTLFAWAYILIVTMGFFVTIYGLAQHTLGQAPYALWALPASLLLIGLVYIAALCGQRVGHAQTEELTLFLEACVSGD